MFHFFISFFIFAFSITAQASAPKNYIDSFTDVGEGVRIRTALMPGDRSKITGPRQVAIFVPGRTSCVENNLNLAKRLSSQGIDFWAMDNRGHGLSRGRLENPEGDYDQRCHIDSFDTYIKDLETVITHKILPYYGREDVEFTLMGMSMGGNIVLRYLQEHEGDVVSLVKFKQAVVFSPMVKFLTPGFPEPLARALAFLGNLFGYGEHYVPGHGERDLDASFATYTGSHNQEDWEAQQAFYERHPEMTTAGATYSWIKAAFESCDQLRYMRHCSTPIVGFLAGDDTHVDWHATADFLWRLRHTEGTEQTVYRHARHIVTREPEGFIPGFWTDLLALFEDKGEV